MNTHSCPFCNLQMSKVQDQAYPNLITFLCYGCGYSIDTTMCENKELLKAYERIFSRFHDVLKPKNLDRFKPLEQRSTRSDDFFHEEKSDGDYPKPFHRARFGQIACSWNSLKVL